MGWEVKRPPAQFDHSGPGLCLVETDPESEQDQDGVRLATMHRLKGLEFSRMTLVSVQDGVVPPPAALAAAADEVSREDVELQERCLLYVAMTRARDELVVMGYGGRCRLL